MFVFSGEFSNANFSLWLEISITNEHICAAFYVAINAMCTKPESVWVYIYVGGVWEQRWWVIWLVNAVLPSIDMWRIYFILSYFMAAVNMHFPKGLVVALLFHAFEIPSTCLIYIKHLYAYAYDVPMEIFMQIANDSI